MTEKTPHEIKCDMLFDQYKTDIERVERKVDRHREAEVKKDDEHCESINVIKATLSERERAETARNNHLAKFAPLVLGIIFSLVSGLVWSNLEGIKSWIAAHEKIIENRDTVQCTSIQTMQLAYNNTQEGMERPVKIIECGVGAG